MKPKDLILVVSPNDFDIAEAVNSWEERGYAVQTHSISNLKNVVDELMRVISKFDQVRLVFLESAWGGIPSGWLVYLIHRLRAEPMVKWFTFLKK